MKKALVITSIAAPNPVLKKCAEGAGQYNFRFIVMGDVISPPDFLLTAVIFSIPNGKNWFLNWLSCFLKDIMEEKISVILLQRIVK